MLNEFCPRCGEHRIGMFRFCRGCGLDFDSEPVETEPLESEIFLGKSRSATARPTRRYLALGVAALFGLGVIGNVSGLSGATTQTSLPQANGAEMATAAPHATTPTASALEPTATPSEPVVLGSAPSGPTVEATVVRVIDGDTIVVAFEGSEYHVRYIGMDTPETVDPNSPVEWMGVPASDANTALVAGKTVYLEKDVSEVDRFGRLLRFVWLKDAATWTLVNLELVRQGFAFAKSYPPDVLYDELYTAAEGEARQSSLGLWGPTPAPPTPKPTPRRTPKPTPKPTAKPKAARNCHPSYAGACLRPDASDYDCAGGSGNGPYYTGRVRVVGPDVFDLDRDGDGIGCD